MIFIISSNEDPHTQAVGKELDKTGTEYYILDLSEFPMSMDIGISISNGTDDQFALRFKNGKRIDFSKVKSVWWRRPRGFQFPSELTDPVHRSFAQQESDLAFKGMWSCSNALWINDIVRDATASHKPLQLHIAKSLGFNIPHTLITNCADDVKRFCDNTTGKVIYKAFLASSMAWRETRILSEADKELLVNVKVAPVIFQSYIPADKDLRVTIIGGEIFAAEADTRNAEYATDIRMNPKISWKPHTLPDDISKLLLKFMDILDLEYGAIDFRVTPEGKYVFLEINPAGQFLFIQNATGMNLAKTLAKRLIQAKSS